ncbi:MAG: helix-hairpin-helix domain-containing protein [Candidatus Riflebacteria bacterium]|nr:helix-hairpin-helix domain-containing protein [Candidatus Riflebacteria bacterium]
MPQLNREEQRLVLVALGCVLAASAVWLFSPPGRDRPRGRPAPQAAASPLPALIGTFRPDPNEAPLEDLLQVPGMTPVMAQTLVKVRTDRIFVSPSDLELLPGLSSAEAGRLATGLRFPGSRTPAEPTAVIDLNQATAAQLERIPGIGPMTAKAILERRDRKPFTDVEDLLSLPGIGPGKLERLQRFVTVGVKRPPGGP